MYSFKILMFPVPQSGIYRTLNVFLTCPIKKLLVLQQKANERHSKMLIVPSNNSTF